MTRIDQAPGTRTAGELGVVVRGIMGVLCMHNRVPDLEGHPHRPGLSELPRIPIPRTPVNKGMEKGRGPVL
jgi:hypothetical protein